MLHNLRDEYFFKTFESKLNKLSKKAMIISIIIVYPIVLFLNFDAIFNIIISFITPIVLMTLLFVNDFKKVSFDTISLKEKLCEYIKQYNNNTFENLLLLLSKNGIKTKNDLKYLIEHYESELPKKKNSFSIWDFIAISLSLTSIIGTTYSEELKKIDYTKLSAIIGSTIGIIAIIIITTYTFKFFINSFMISKKEKTMQLLDDLYYIYFNFNKYAKKIIKKRLIK